MKVSNDKHKSYTFNHFDVFIDTLLAVIATNDPLWTTIHADWEMLRTKTVKTIAEIRDATVKSNP